MQAVELFYHQDMVILRARGSELLILPQHVVELQKCTSTQQFSEYFLESALVNRPARKLFTAWLRKDPNVWRRLFTLIHENKQAPGDEADAQAASSEVAEKS